MSMSTKIDDLPGPIDEDIANDLSKIQNDIHQNPRQINDQYVGQLNELDSNQTNIKMDIKKGFILKNRHKKMKMIIQMFLLLII